jgi:protein-tyrosine kinase
LIYMLDEKSVIVHASPKSPISEAFRVLRTNIQYSSVDKPLKTIVVTSSGPYEGKTTTIANLVVTFAQMGNRVLLIDSDLRKPKIHKLFGMSNRLGLTNFLAAHDDYKNYLHKCEVPNVDILTCGTIPPNPSELLMSNSMKQFIQQVREDYDMVFLDAPPVGNVTDAAIISTIVDGTILVASSGTVEIDALKRAKELLDKVNAHIIGVVLNKLDKNAKGNYYYYYYYYYGEDGQGQPHKLKKHRKKPGGEGG